MGKRKPRKPKSNTQKFLKTLGSKRGKKLTTLAANSKRAPVVDPLWDLERDGVTNSMLSKFLGCRHRTHIAYVEGWKPKSINFPLEFGNLFHLMDEAYGKGYTFDTLPKLAANYVEAKMHQGTSPSEIKELSMFAAVCAVTFRKYREYWDNNYSFVYKRKKWFETQFQWFEKEEPFAVMYRMPNGRKVKLCGVRDGGFTLPFAGCGNILGETKTKGDIDVQGISQALHKDLQTGLYMVSMFLNSGNMPIGVLYNVIRRTRLKPRVADTPVTFAERVEEDIDKRPEFYFMRWFRQITRQEMDDFCKRTLEPVLYQFLTWADSRKRNPLNPFVTPCPECDGRPTEQGKVDCLYCNGKGEVPNPHHYERPFGVHDSMAYSQRGDFFDIITDGNYFNYERKTVAHAEMQDDNVERYLNGISVPKSITEKRKVRRKK